MPRAPHRHGVVRGRSCGESQGVLQHQPPLPVDALEQPEIHTRHLGNRLQAPETRRPDERVGRIEPLDDRLGGR